MLSRRSFGALMAGGAWLLPGLARAGDAASDAGLPKVEDFARDPFLCVPQISPNGKKLAWIRGHDVVVYDIESAVEKTASAGQFDLGGVEWIDNDHFVAYVKEATVPDGNGLRVLGYSPLVLDANAHFLRFLFEREGKKMSAADLKPIICFRDTPGPTAVTLAFNNTYLVDVQTGHYTIGPRLMPGSEHFFDGQGHERVAIEVKDIKVNAGILCMTIRYRAQPDGATRAMTVGKIGDKNGVLYSRINYAFAENALYWREMPASGGEISIFRYDLESGAKTLYKTSSSQSIDVVLDRAGRVIGARWAQGRIVTEWTDPARLKLTDAIETIFPRATVDIVDMAPGQASAVLLVSAPEAPDTYYYYDAASKELEEIGCDFPELEGKPLAGMNYITYKARDGLEIPAYVTRRKDTPARAPLVVFPHGGPAGRDIYGFDYLAQWLASRGYVVLQPQYRGSYGFGASFEKAGDGHLDLMVSDLEDGVRFLQAQGAIDPARVAIVGWSWGGYLTQAALALTPDLYVCGVSGAGVSDLMEFLDEHDDFWLGGYVIDYWRNLIGQPFHDEKRIRAVSPIEHVAAIKAPLLLIHGAIDPTVSIHQSEHMAAAMKKAGKTVTYLPVDHMRHGPATMAQRLEVLKAIDGFVAAAFKAVRA